ncbi:MAG: hypothetical protein V8S32_00495 [Lachnospiraceae bacterium]
MAFEEDHVNYNQWAEMKKEIPAELIGTSGIIDSYRTIKTPEEIQYLKNACDLASRAYEMLLKDVRVGITEKELESKLSYYMVTLGGASKTEFQFMYFWYKEPLFPARNRPRSRLNREIW